jgi:hypothetical protein
MAGGGGRDRPRVGMVLYGDLTYDSRVRKEARTLALGAYVRVIVCAAVDPSALPGGANPFRSSSSGRLRSLAGGVGWLLAYAGNLRAWGRSAIAACGPVDIWHAHDLTGLAALGPVAGKNLPIVYDSHELYLETGTASRLPKPARTLLRHYEHRLVSGASAGSDGAARRRSPR